MEKQKNKENVSHVKQTQRLMEAGAHLRGCRDDIDNIIKTISSKKNIDYTTLADKCVDLSLDLYNIAKLFRKISIASKARSKKP